jgi:hypothetical protein
MSHTPTPWHAHMPAESNGYAHVSTSAVNDLIGGDIATTWPKADGEYTAFANARLIARSVNIAPKLAEALSGLMTGLAANDEEGLIEHVDAMAIARAALKEWYGK